MALGDEIVVRLIVWQGQLQQGSIQHRQIKVYSEQLKESINESVVGTQWRYQMWKTYESGSIGKHKLEVRIRHSKTAGASEACEAIHELCNRLLNSSLATKLRLLNPGVTFTFCPSKEGRVTSVDEIFARCFSVAVVTRYCVGNTHSQELERMRDNFLSRNSTKYLYQPQVPPAIGKLTNEFADWFSRMVAAYTAADLAERYSALIEKMLKGIELLNGKAQAGSGFAKAARDVTREALEEKGMPKSESRTKKLQLDTANSQRARPKLALSNLANEGKALVSDETPDASKSKEENSERLKLCIAIACWLTRAFVAYAPTLKKQLEPKLKELNQVIIRSRLTLASQAYINASKAPVEALAYLQNLNSPTADDIAMTINSFGSLMQSTLPLFDVTLTISDAEFNKVTALAASAGVGLAALGGGSIWMMCAGAAMGPIGLTVAGGCATVALGAAAIAEGVKWGNRQKTNPATVLLSIQKSLEECCRFLLGLLFMAAEQNATDDKMHLDKVQTLKESLSSDLFLNPGYMQAYYKNVSLKLKEDMQDLATGLRRHGAEIAMS